MNRACERNFVTFLGENRAETFGTTQELLPSQNDLGLDQFLFVENGTSDGTN